MFNVRVDVPNTIFNGYEVVFIAPCDCTEVKGLTIYYPDENGEEANATFVFKDAHGSVLSDMNHLFKGGAYVKVILNVTDGIAYIQNADTNSYIESKFSGIVVAVEVGNWIQQEDGTYTNTVDVEGIEEDDLLDVSLYDEYTEEQAEAFDFLIESISAKDGQVVFTSSEEINVSLSILLRGRVNMEEKNVFVAELNASAIKYDNSKSSLQSKDTQSAIDELAISIGGLVVLVTTSDWVQQEDGTYKKVIPLSQITGNETFDVSLFYRDGCTEEQIVAFSEYITSIETSEGAIILTAIQEITVDLTVFLYGKVNFDKSNLVALSDRVMEVIPISRENFEKLTEEQKKSNIYYVTDDDEINAKNIEFDSEGTDLGNNVHEAIHKCFQSGSDFKARVASGITAKKVPTDATDSVETILNNLSAIRLGSGNATKADVLVGKTFTNDDGVEYVGEMPNIGDIDDAISSTYVGNGSHGRGIYARMNHGAHVQKASSGFPELFIPQEQITPIFSATATSADITNGKTAWVNGVLVTGTRPAPTKYLTGSKSQNIANGASVTWTFTFSTPFDTTPTVTWTANFTLSGGKVSNVSRTGFTFSGTLRSGEWSTSEYVTFNWTATV